MGYNDFYGCPWINWELVYSFQVIEGGVMGGGVTFSGVVYSVLFLFPLAVDILSDGYSFYSPISFDTGRGEQHGVALS